VNLAFFLTPVAEVVWLPAHARVREVIDTLRLHRYTAVPLLDDAGRYLGTLTEGDLLHHLTAPDPHRDARLSEIERRVDHRPVGVDTDIRELLAVAADQNFVPVVDSRGVLMGIVTRRTILAFCERLLREQGLLPMG
jgi:CBS domain-containing protein